MSKYLDYNGAQKLWDKVKLWVQTRLNAKADKEHTHSQYHQDGQDYAMINYGNEFTFVPDGFGGENGDTVYFNYRTKGGTNGKITDYAFGNGHGGTLGHLTTREWSNDAYAAKSHSHSYNDLTDKPAIPSAVTMDSALSGTSTNPVQNKVVSAALSQKASVSTVNSLDGRVVNLEQMAEDQRSDIAVLQEDYGNIQEDLGELANKTTDLGGYRIRVVSAMPTTPESDVIYFVTQ